MDVSIIILRQLLIMCLYMAIGWLLFRKGLITKEGTKSLVNLFVYGICPCVMINSFCSESNPEKNRVVLLSFLGALLLMVISMITSHLLCRKNRIAEFGVLFSNAGFIGIPLVSAAFGDDAVIYAIGTLSLFAVLQWTYGQAILTGDMERLSPKKFFINPVVLPFIIGLFIYFLQVPVPALLKDTLSAMSALNSPIAMIILGTYLGEIPFVSIFKEKRLWVYSFYRLLVIPVITLFFLLLFLRSHMELAQVLIIMAAPPVGANAAVYAMRLGEDYHQAVRLVCLSTFLCVITMPLVLILWDFLCSLL